MKIINRVRVYSLGVLLSLFFICGNCYAGHYADKLIERGKEYFDQGKYDEAIREFTLALVIGPYNSQAYYNRGRALHALAEFDDAISDYSIAIQIDPTNAEIYHNRGNLHYYRYELDLAISDWSKSIKLCPDCYQSYDNRAFAYYEKGLYDLAWGDVEKLKEMGFQVSEIFIDTLTRRSSKEADLTIIEKHLKGNPSQKYLLLIPEGYNPDQAYPLFIAIHKYPGDAMRQINEWKYLANKAGYILLHPEFAPNYQDFLQAEDRRLIQIIKEIKKDFNIAEDKIFFLGFSEGAQFVLRFIFKYPKYPRAVCLLAGREYEFVIPSYGRLRKIDFFIAAGEKGKRYRAARELYTQFNQHGYKVKFETFPLLGYRFNSKIKYAVIDFLNEIK